MIICDEREFAFIHVPKCAGTSVRRALGPLDTTGQAFFHIAEHRLMGAVHMAHLTLADLALHFPDTFGQVRRYRSMALVRDPLDRFYSAIFQRLREFKGVAQSAITPTVVKAEAEGVVRYLESRPERIDLHHVHFTRQCDFLELGGERVVRDLFPVTDMARAAAHILAVTGVDISNQRENRTTALRFAALRPLQKALRGPYARLVPAELREQIRARMTAAGVYAPVGKEQIANAGSAVERFVRDYYVRDFAILDEAIAPTAKAA